MTIEAHETWLYNNTQALAMVLQGLQEARDGKFIQGPDLDADDELFSYDDTNDNSPAKNRM